MHAGDAMPTAQSVPIPKRALDGGLRLRGAAQIHPTAIAEEGSAELLSPPGNKRKHPPTTTQTREIQASIKQIVVYFIFLVLYLALRFFTFRRSLASAFYFFHLTLLARHLPALRLF